MMTSGEPKLTFSFCGYRRESSKCQIKSRLGQVSRIECTLHSPTKSYRAGFLEPFTAITSISTKAQGAAKAATSMALRAGLLGCSLVPKKRV